MRLPRISVQPSLFRIRAPVPSPLTCPNSMATRKLFLSPHYWRHNRYLIMMITITVISSCFAKKMLSKKRDFSRLKCQLKRKKSTEHFCKDVTSFSRKGNGQWVNLSSCQLKSVFKLVLAWLAREKQYTLTSQPCLHTLMQTRLSANQSARTILVIL